MAQTPYYSEKGGALKQVAPPLPNEMPSAKVRVSSKPFVPDIYQVTGDCSALFICKAKNPWSIMQCPATQASGGYEYLAQGASSQALTLIFPPLARPLRYAKPGTSEPSSPYKKEPRTFPIEYLLWFPGKGPCFYSLLSSPLTPRTLESSNPRILSLYPSPAK